MLLFRSEEHVERWCKQWKLGPGGMLSLETGWKLADAWYRNRMASDWRRRTVQEAEALLKELGLTSPFWKLS